MENLKNPQTQSKTLLKAFIGGFSPQTTKSSLETYFQKYPSFSKVTIIKKPKNGRHMGFGYVFFTEKNDFLDAISEKHKLFGKLFRVKKIYNKNTRKNMKADTLKRKVFVGGLYRKTKEATLEAFFSQFGEIEDLMINRTIKSLRSKGCAFIIFKSEEVAKNLYTKNRFHIVDGREVECYECKPKGYKKPKVSNENLSIINNAGNSKLGSCIWGENPNKSALRGLLACDTQLTLIQKAGGLNMRRMKLPVISSAFVLLDLEEDNNTYKQLIKSIKRFAENSEQELKFNYNLERVNFH